MNLRSITIPFILGALVLVLLPVTLTAQDKVGEDNDVRYQAGIGVGPQLSFTWNTTSGSFRLPFAVNPSLYTHFTTKGLLLPTRFALGIESRILQYISSGRGAVQIQGYFFPFFIRYGFKSWATIKWSGSFHLGPGLLSGENTISKKTGINPALLYGFGNRVAYDEYFPNIFWAEILLYHGFEFAQAGLANNMLLGVNLYIGTDYEF